MRCRWLSSVEDCLAYCVNKTGNASKDYTLARARLKLHLPELQKIQRHLKVHVFKPTIPDNVQTLSKAITSRLAGVDGDGSLDEQLRGLEVSTVSESAGKFELTGIITSQTPLCAGTVWMSNGLRHIFKGLPMVVGPFPSPIWGEINEEEPTVITLRKLEMLPRWPTEDVS